LKSAFFNKKNIFSLSVIGLGLILLSGCSGGGEIISVWQENEIKIDGSLTDWNRNILKIPEKGISVGFRNDARYLYICFASEYRGRILTLLKDGLTIWFEPASGENNIFGIQYPVPSAQIKARDITEMVEGGLSGEEPEKVINNLLLQQNELQILDRNRTPMTALPILNDEGIEARLGYRSSQFIYELKIPLLAKKGFSYAADTTPGGKIKIRFESEELLEENKGGIKSIGLASGGMNGRDPYAGKSRAVTRGLMVETLFHTVDLKLDSAPPRK
jgi:hypothetical protein